jgi:CopG family nickel-responsive transcriptional regulator
MSTLTRFGIAMDSQLLKRFDDFIIQRGYANRSEAIRDLVRDRLVRTSWEEGDEEMVGTITLVYNHHQRELTEKLTSQQHDFHHAILSAMHVHLDQHNCLEILAVRGPAKVIRQIADQLISVRGVKHGKLVMTSTGEGL